MTKGMFFFFLFRSFVCFLLVFFFFFLAFFWFFVGFFLFSFVFIYSARPPGAGRRSCGLSASSEVDRRRASRSRVTHVAVRAAASASRLGELG